MSMYPNIAPVNVKYGMLARQEDSTRSIMIILKDRFTDTESAQMEDYCKLQRLRVQCMIVTHEYRDTPLCTEFSLQKTTMLSELTALHGPSLTHLSHERFYSNLRSLLC